MLGRASLFELPRRVVADGGSLSYLAVTWELQACRITARAGFNPREGRAAEGAFLPVLSWLGSHKASPWKGLRDAG